MSPADRAKACVGADCHPSPSCNLMFQTRMQVQKRVVLIGGKARPAFTRLQIRAS